jgi:hypothetical protein
MKKLRNILLMMAVAAAAGCENYSDTEVGYSTIFPLSGEWRVRVKNVQTNALLTQTMYTFGTYNTADNSSDIMWLRTTSSMAGGVGALRGKVSCNVGALTFSVEASDNNNLAPVQMYYLIVGGDTISTHTINNTFSVSDGKVERNAIDMPSGVSADKISFRLTVRRDTTDRGTFEGTYLMEGYRRTFWGEDESFIAF